MKAKSQHANVWGKNFHLRDQECKVVRKEMMEDDNRAEAVNIPQYIMYITKPVYHCVLSSKVHGASHRMSNKDGN